QQTVNRLCVAHAPNITFTLSDICIAFSHGEVRNVINVFVLVRSTCVFFFFLSHFDEYLVLIRNDVRNTQSLFGQYRNDLEKLLLSLNIIKLQLQKCQIGGYEIKNNKQKYICYKEPDHKIALPYLMLNFRCYHLMLKTAGVGPDIQLLSTNPGKPDQPFMEAAQIIPSPRSKQAGGGVGGGGGEEAARMGKKVGKNNFILYLTT
ncbi:hypothetical protein ACJX0J_007635, partial [Zea mays]